MNHAHTPSSEHDDTQNKNTKETMLGKNHTSNTTKGITEKGKKVEVGNTTVNKYKDKDIEDEAKEGTMGNCIDERVLNKKQTNTNKTMKPLENSEKNNKLSQELVNKSNERTNMNFNGIKNEKGRVNKNALQIGKSIEQKHKGNGNLISSKEDYKKNKDKKEQGRSKDNKMVNGSYERKLNNDREYKSILGIDNGQTDSKEIITNPQGEDIQCTGDNASLKPSILDKNHKIEAKSPEINLVEVKLDSLSIEREASAQKAKRSESILKEIYEKLHKTEDKLRVRLLNKIQTEIKRTSDVARIRDANWEMFDLSPLLIESLADMKFAYPSPVQVSSIPEALSFNNLIVRAKNGTGKTLSFVIPILERSIRESVETDFALIMVPTRELAMQVGKVFRKVGVYCKTEAIATFGGSHYHEDIIRIKKGVGIIVGTPGRLFDLINKNVIVIERFKVVVLDEADKLLAKEFKENIDNIVGRFLSTNIPKQLMLFSATFPVEISDFTKNYLKEPREINLMPELYLKGVNQFYVKVKYAQKLHCLRTLIRKTAFDKCIIFCNSIASAEKLGYRVVEMNIACYFFHSHMQNDDRKNIFHQFTTTNDIQVLITTDLITRGIDVPDVNLVINFDFPGSTESFLHRIGRAGRFGRIGCAISMCDNEEMEEMMWIERQTGVEIKGISHSTFKNFMKSE